MKISNLKFNIGVLQNNPYAFKDRENRQAPINFKGFDCPEDSFEIKKLYNIPCPVCGIDMLSRKQMNCAVSNIEDSKGKELIKNLEKYDKFFHDKERKVSEILKYEALIEQDKSLSQLTKEHYEQMLKKIRKSQKFALKQLRQFLNNQKHSQFKQTDKILEKYENILKKDDSSYFDERDLFSDLGVFFESSLINQKDFKKVLSNFPDTRGEFSFFAKFYDSSNSKIASSLLFPSLSTCEHIKPKAKGGRDNTENYLAQCQECNSKREDKDFYDWIKLKFNFGINIKRYINKILEYFNSGQLPKEYDTYFEDIAKTIKEETRGLVEIDVPKIERAETLEIEQTKDFKLQNIEQMLKDKQEQLDILLQKKAALFNDEEFKAICQYKFLVKQKEKAEIALKKERSSLNTKAYKKAKPNKKINRSTTKTSIGKNKGQVKLNKRSQVIASSKKRIENLTLINQRLEDEINALKTKITFPKTCEKQIEYLLSLPNSYEYKKEIENLELKYEQAKEKFSCVNINSRIYELQRSVGNLESFLWKYNIGRISFNHLVKLVSKI